MQERLFADHMGKDHFQKGCGISNAFKIETGTVSPEPEVPQDLIIEEQLIRDEVSGLTLRFFSTERYNRLSIYGENGNRDFFFDKDGTLDGTGSGCGRFACSGPPLVEV